jgi:DNA-binding transcriptional MerR regulator
MSPYEVLIPIVAILIGGLVVLIPIAGITARFALKPIIEAISQLRSGPGSDQRVAYLEQRLSLVEEQMHALERDNQRLLEESDFRKQLESPRI